MTNKDGHRNTDFRSDDVLQFWFGTTDEHGNSLAAVRERWFRKSPDFDREIEHRFAALYWDVVGGKHDDWLEHARSSLAYIIVLDQLSRNMFRGSAMMYYGDVRALHAAHRSIGRGFDEELRGDMQPFFYMPLMHSEGVADQNLCVHLFERLAHASSGHEKERLLQSTNYAIAHRDIVARFGRFPHRNAIFGRRSTEEEAAFLKEPGASF